MMTIITFGNIKIVMPSVRRKWRPLNPLTQLIGTVERFLISITV